MSQIECWRAKSRLKIESHNLPKQTQISTKLCYEIIPRDLLQRQPLKAKGQKKQAQTVCSVRAAVAR